MPKPKIYENREIILYDQGEMQPVGVQIVREIPLTVFLNDTELATLVCSPGSYKELAVGFLLSEGLVQDVSDIKDITFNEEDGLLWIYTDASVPDMENFLRRQIASCCGKGRALLYFVNDARQLSPVQSTVQFTASHLLNLINRLEDNSATFRLTGGVHSAALADNAEMLVMYEDIGRHNAVDKAMGYAFLNRISFDDKCIMLSGRISSEILIKAAHRGMPLVLSRSAPTLLAVELAEQLNITVVGFARGQRLNIYTHGERVMP